MAQAMIEDTVIADSDETIRIEGNTYFPPSAVKMEYFTDTDLHTVCHWKGEANYRDIKVGDKVLKNASWYYPSPKDGANERVGRDITGWVAFYPIVKVVD